MRLIPLSGWPLVAVLAGPLAAAAALAAALVYVPDRSLPPVSGAAAAVVLPSPETGLLVDVSGAVLRPGLYRLARGDRVLAAIAAAGGLAPDADRSRLPNLAGRLRDGEQVRVPSLRGGSSSSRAAALDLNSATVDQLAAVPGFTRELAQAAADYRSNFGGFQSSRELVTVLGMGEAQYAQAKRYVRV